MRQLNQLMQQAQQMQKKMELLQTELENTMFDGTSGAGMVTATVNGKGIIEKLKISPTIVDANDVEMLEDLIVAAIRDAKTKADTQAAEAMGKITGNMKLPGGMGLPF